MKVLLATDFSESSQAAVESAKSSPWSQGAHIRLVHSIDLFRFTLELATLNEMKSFSAETLDRIASGLRRPGLCVTTEVIVDNPRDAICGLAKKWSADLIIVGSHGRGTLGRLLLGSVAQSVLRSAPCNVEIARPVPKCEEDCQRTAVLIATDGSEYSTAAVRFAGSRPWPNEPEFRLISVVPLVTPLVDASTTYLHSSELAKEMIALRERQERQATSAIARARALLGEVDASQIESAETVCDDPRRAILAEAKRSHATHIVVGSHGWHGLDRILIGSVSEYIATHATCSVTVVKAAQQKQT